MVYSAFIWHGRLLVKKYTGSGHWVTINGRHVLIGGKIDERRKASNTLRKVETEIRHKGIEHGAVINQNGDVIWRGIGGRNYINPPEDKKILKGNIFTHNHPEGRGFDKDDFLNLLRFKIAEVRAVTDNNTYVIRPPIGFSWGHEQIKELKHKIRKWQKDADREAYEEASQLWFAGKQIPPDYFTHKFAMRVAQKTGIRYERRNG